MEPSEFYAASNLRGNPFRPSAVGIDDPRSAIWVGYDRQRDIFQRLLSRVRADQVGLTSFILLYGHFGTGKSHALLWGRHWVRSNKAGVAYYMPTLKREKGRLSIAAAIREDLIGRSILSADLVRYYAWLTTKVLEVTQERPGIQPDEAIRSLFPVAELSDFARGIYHTGGNDDQIKAYAIDGLGSEFEAVTTFAKIVNLFVLEIGVKSKSRFAPAVYLFIDELDDLARQPAKDSLQTNDTLRHLYDACPNSFGLVLGATAEVNTLQHLFTEYVLSRMTRRIEFEFLDQDAAKDFIKKVLDESRVDPRMKAKKGYFPLDGESVDAIVSHLRQITPRDIVNTMQQVLEEMRLADLKPSDGPIPFGKLDSEGVLDSIFDNG